jgi:transposase
MSNTPVQNTFAGIDVGAEELVLLLRKGGAAEAATALRNSAAGRAELVRKLTKHPGITICLEATGTYSLELAVALADAGLRVMVVNPQSSHNFAKVLGSHSKTDQVDAGILAQYAERMPFRPWRRPSDAELALHTLARRIRALTDERAAAKNQLHAMSYNQHAPKAVLADIKQGIGQLDKRIAKLASAALAFIQKDAELKKAYSLLVTIKGVGDTSAIALLGELLILPKGLRAPQWVKYAGLDPKHFRSGSSVDKKPRISKAGNAHLRAALYMPALSAKNHDPHVKAFAEHLIARGKTPMQAVCAVMRKLLHAIHGMLAANKPFDNTRFFAIPDQNSPHPA